MVVGGINSQRGRKVTRGRSESAADDRRTSTSLLVAPCLLRTSTKNHTQSLLQSTVLKRIIFDEGLNPIHANPSGNP